MAKIICVIGNKGGTGKTTISHMLCQGLGLLGQRSVCVLTDQGREPLRPEGRRYLTADARSPDTLEKVISKIQSLDRWIGVIDGGANRPEVDRRLYAAADVVLLPFRDSHEDMRTVLSDLESFPRAFGLPSQWPTNPWQRELADKTLGELLVRKRRRLLEAIPSVSSSKLLLQREIPESLPTNLANACRRLASCVLDQLEDSDRGGDTLAVAAEGLGRYPYDAGYSAELRH